VTVILGVSVTLPTRGSCGRGGHGECFRRFEPGLVLQSSEAHPVTRIGSAFLCDVDGDATDDLPLIATLIFRGASDRVAWIGAGSPTQTDTTFLVSVWIRGNSCPYTGTRGE
jgi:hypothetical protein